MSSIQIQFRLNHTSPLYQWIRQMEDSGENVSEAIRTALECQLAQDVNSTYQGQYKVRMLNSRKWIIAQRVGAKFHTDKVVDLVNKELAKGKKY